MATRAVFRRDLQRIQLLLHPFPFWLDTLEGLRSTRQQLRGIDLRPDHSVRAYQHALPALDAQLLVPHRNHLCDIALLPLRRTRWKRSTRRQRTHRQQVPSARRHLSKHIMDERRCLPRQHRQNVERRTDRLGHLHLVQVSKRSIDGRKILLHHHIAAFPIGLLDGLLDMFDCFVTRQHTADRKEACLHDGIDAVAHPRLTRHGVPVDHIKLKLLRDDGRLRRSRQMLPHRLRPIRRVQQKHCSRSRRRQNIHPLKELELVARHKIRLGDKVRRPDRVWAKPQMRYRHRARLLRIVNKVTLRIIRCLRANNLDRILVRPHRPIRTQSIEQRTYRPRVLRRKLRVILQARMRNVVLNPDREMILGRWLFEFVKNALHHGWRKFLGRQSIPSTHHSRMRREPRRSPKRRLAQRSNHILVKRLPECSRLLGPVQHRNRLDRLRQRRNKCLSSKRPVQPHLQQPKLLPLQVESADRLFRSPRTRTHQHHDSFRVRCPKIIEQVILTSRQVRKLVHRVLHNRRASQIKGITGFARLKKNIRILRRTTQNWLVRVERPLTVPQHKPLLEQRLNRLIRNRNRLIDLVRCPKSIEKMQKRNPRLQRRNVRDQRQVASLLHRVRRQHRISRRPARHHIRVVAKDRQRMGSNRPRRHVNHIGGQLTRNLVQIWNHQQQALRSRKGRTRRPTLQRPVHRTRRPTFALQLRDQRNRSPNIFSSLHLPLIRPLRHRRRGSDGVDRNHLCKPVSD